MTPHEKAQKILQMTVELVEEARSLENQQVAGLFRTFGENFISSTELMAKWLSSCK